MLMPKYKTLGLMVILCSGLALATGAQKKPGAPAQKPSRPGQVQPASGEQNKAVVRRVFDDLFTGGRYGEIEQIYAKDCKVHFGNRTRRLDEAVAEGKGWRSAAPDLVMTADQMSVDGDKVTVNWSARGTHTGKSAGLKPTGKRISMRGRSVFRVVNGKIVEAWNEEYRDELYRQLGVNPKLGHLYDLSQDFLLAMNRIFSNKDTADASVQSSR
jgi:predicted ester cyclase